MKNLFHKKLSVDNIRPKAEEMQKGKPLLSDAALSDLGTSKAASGKNVYPAESDRNQDKQTEVLNSVQKVISSYNYIPTGNFLLTKDGKIAGLNLNGKQLLHQGRASLKGSLFESFVTDDTKSIFKNFFKRVYNDQANIPCEITLLTTGYPPTYVFLTGSLRKNKELCLITAINITERKQTEILLLQERELYQDIVNNQPAGIYRIRVFQSEKRRKNAWESSENPPYCIELASDRFCEILRITRKEFEDNPAIIADLIHPQDLSEFSIKNEEANTRIIPFRWEGRIVIQGEVSWIHLESIPRVLAIDDVLWTGILYDITRQKQVEEELRVSENKYRELVAKLPDAINIYSEGKIVFVNNECLRLTGAKNAEELIGKQVIDFIHPDYRLLAVERINDLTNNGKALLVIEEKLIRVDGSVIDVEVKAMPILFQNKPAVQSIMRDITERKEADLKTKESQENFIDLFDNAPVGYHEIDTEGRIVRMNQTELTMLGYTADEVLGHYIWSLVSPEEISRKETKKKLSGEQATSKFYEREFCKKDGKLLSVLLRDKLLKDADGHIYGNRTTLLDITERKQSELKLQLSEERFRNIFENSIVGKSITTLDGRLSVNKAFSQIVGYTKEELSHMHWSGFTDKEDIEFNKKEVEQILSGEKNSSHWEKRFTHKNGNLIWADISTFLLRDHEGHPVHFITEIYDITERKQAEAALQASEELYRNMVYRIPDGVYKSTPEGKFLDVNPAMVKILGYSSKEELMSIDIKSQLYFDLADRESSILEEQKEEIGVYALKRKDGSKIWIEDHGWHNTDQTGNVITYEGVLRDINERKLAQDALQEREAILKKTLIESTDLIDVGSEGIDYKKIADIILEISGAKFVGFNLFDENGSDFTSVALSGEKEHILNASKYLGFEVIGKKWRFNPYLEERTRGKTITRFESLSEVSRFAISKKITTLIENVFNLGEHFVVKIMKNNRPIGNFTLFYSKGDSLRNNELVLLFSNQVGLFIDRNRTDKALRINEEKYRFLFANNPQPMYIYDLETLAFLEVNLAAVEHYGYTKEEFLSMTIKDIRPKEDIPALLMDVQDDRTSYRPSGEWRHIKKNGEIIFVDITTMSMVSNGKKVRYVLVQDISERKRAENALKESVSLLNATIESTEDGILVVGMNESITLFNQRFADMWKVPKELLYNKDDEPLLNYVSSQVKKREVFLDKVRCLYENKELSSNDQIELLDGRIFDRYSLPHKIGDDIVGRLWSFRDITLSKKTEEALRVSEEKFRSITEQIDDLITISDSNGIIKYASPAAKKLFQYESEEMIGLPFMEFIHEDSMSAAINAFRTGMNDKKKAVDIELKLKRKDGSIFFGELNGTGFNNGDLNGTLVILHDISSRKQTIEQLQDSEEKFRSIAEQLSDLIAITDDKGCILYASPASRSLFRMESNEMYGHIFTDFLDEESIAKATAAFNRSLETDESIYNLELRIKRKDGSLFYGELNGTLFNRGGNKETLVVIRDISKRMKAQEELEKRMDELLRFHNLTVDRELTMIELKKEVNKLLQSAGKNEKYKIVG